MIAAVFAKKTRDTPSQIIVASPGDFTAALDAHRIFRPMAAIAKCAALNPGHNVDEIGYTVVTPRPIPASDGTLFPLISQAVRLKEAFAAPVHAPDFKSGVRL